MRYHEYQECIEACLNCVYFCNHCASSCLEEEDSDKLARCIQLDLECAAVCKAAADLMALGSDHANQLCQICADICAACAEECDKYTYSHCRECAKICRVCAEECSSMAAA
jgi:hypothetical protein